MKSRHDEIRKKYGKSVDRGTSCMHKILQLIVPYANLLPRTGVTILPTPVFYFPAIEIWGG